MVDKEYTLDEIKERDGEDGRDLWIIIGGKIYNVTNFKHPGGREALEEDHGSDRKDEFDSIHSAAAKRQMNDYYVGKLKESKQPNQPKDNTVKENAKKPAQTNYGVFVIIPLIVIFGLIFYKDVFGIFSRRNK